MSVNEDELTNRLNNAWTLLEEEGYYTKANTIVMALERIEMLENQLKEAEERLLAANKHIWEQNVWEQTE